MDNFKQMIKTKVQDISSKDLNIDFAEPKVILAQSIIRQMIRKVVDIIEKDLSSAQSEKGYTKADYIMALHKEYGCDFVTAEKAHDMALEYLRSLSKLKG